MSNPTIEDKPFIERSNSLNVRHICYSLLSKVIFDGEPIVPAIISEKQDTEFFGNVFEVERLGGEDLYDYIKNKDHLKSEKLLVLLHVVRQLKAIDEAGYIIFDRHGSNIRVLSSNPQHISVRHVDIEDMYDKQADCTYSLRGSSMSDETADLFKSKGISLWVLAVDKLAVEGELIGEIHDDQAITDIFSLCRWETGERGHSLEELEKACIHAIKISEVTT